MKVGFAATSTSLTGIIEVDEAYFGGKEHNKHMSKRIHGDRGLPQKMAVVGMRERGKDGRTKAQPISPVSRITLERVIRLNVEFSSVVNNDEATYRSWVEHNYTHNTINHNEGQYVSRGASTNNAESVWAVMKWGMDGVYHHASPKHKGR